MGKPPVGRPKRASAISGKFGPATPRHIRMQDDEWDGLKQISGKEGRTVSAQIAHWLKQALARK